MRQFIVIIVALTETVSGQGDARTIYSPDSLTRLYTTNKSAAKALAGTTITVSGTAFRASAKTLVFKTYTNDKLTCSTLNTFVEPQQLIGTIVTVRGRLRGRGLLGNITMDDCDVMPFLSELISDVNTTLTIPEANSDSAGDSAAPPPNVQTDTLPAPLPSEVIPSPTDISSADSSSAAPQVISDVVDGVGHTVGPMSDNRGSNTPSWVRRLIDSYTFWIIACGALFLSLLALRRKCPICRRRKYSISDEECLDSWIGSRTVHNRTTDKDGKTITTTAATIPVTKERWRTTFCCDLCGHKWQEEDTIERD